jgi:serine/threonine protein kinase
MTINYPCSFEDAAQMPLEETLPTLKPGSMRKIKTLSDALNGKIKLVEGFLPDHPNTFVVKQVSKNAKFAGLESPGNEIHAALAIKSLGVPNTAEVYFAAKDEKSYYLATEHCANGELLQVINKAGRLEGDALLREVLFQILLAVGELHRHGVAHRDISLENILVAADGGLRLIDWAQAIMVRDPRKSSAEARVPLTSGPPGKPHYRGPELQGGGSYLATKADTFAIGVILYVLVVGAYPFVPNRSSTMSGVGLFPDNEMKLSRCSRLSSQLQKVCGDISDTISPGCLDMMEQLLAPNPELRLSVEEALCHPWLTGSVTGFWPAEDDSTGVEDSMEEDSEGTDTDSVANLDMTSRLDRRGAAM